MRIVVLQSCGFDHLMAARQAVATRYPGATFVGLVEKQDMFRARESGAFTEVRLMPSDADPRTTGDIMGGPVDLCVVPFESRFGIHHWKSRLLPIKHKVQAVASYNRLGRLREWGRLGWIANSVLVCGGGLPVLWVWGLWGRGLGVVSLFGLAGMALIRHGLRRVRGNLFATGSIRHAPAARRRLVLFIPSMGVGGTQRQMLSFLKHLDRTRWDPELVMLDVPDKFFEPAVRALGVPIVYVSRDDDFRMSGVVLRLMRHLRAHPCHVLHGWLHYAAALGAIAGRLAGTPVVIGSLRSERPGRFPWFYPKWQRALDVLTVPLYTAIIANSNAVREENRRWACIPERKLLTIYNGIDVDESGRPDGAQIQRLRSELSLPAEAPLVGIVGRLFPEKDHATFLRAAALVSRAKPDTRFLIVGDGILRWRIESDIERLGLTGKAQVLGERKDARVLIQLLDVLVLTSVSEGFPNVLVEAAVAGTPVVTTAAGGAVEVVLDGETGYVVPCGDAEALAGRVLQLLGDPALSKRLAEAARDRTRACFSADRAASAIQACYERESAGSPA